MKTPQAARTFSQAVWTEGFLSFRNEWQRSARRWIASAGVLFVLASFTFVFFSFIAFQVQTWLVG